MKILTTKRFWGILVTLVSLFLKSRGIDVPNEVTGGGVTLATAGFIDASKND